MKRKLAMKIGLTFLVVLLALNLIATLKVRAAGRARPEAAPAIDYHVVRVDPSTNQELLFRQAGEQGLEFAGTIQIAGSTGYVIFRK